MGYRVVVQATEIEYPTSFLLWRQRECHTDTDLGGSDCQPADNGSLEKHQETLRFFAGGYHGTTYAHVLCRFYRIHGESRENMG